ncbi:ferrous iron transport protein B [Desulfitobacterium metallireducens]|uniref:ferrous iron transport protein B n=1 Tax=Desulfitobacterium metallireducens TaxID=142877 RepID=UPI0002314D99|nr:ferrous iron transport protein B [Desulfitobacterium metallireducens]
MESLKIALVGNPNVGKSTVFNYLTGLNQQVGNWTGKTVERKAGYFKVKDQTVELVDLPGTYSLTAYSQEEIVTREYILNEKPDVVVAMLDASNIERNLYLLLQILELTTNVVIGLNMMDLAVTSGITISAPKLSQTLNLPVIEVIATKGKGIKELLQEAINLSHLPEAPQPVVMKYPEELEAKIKAIEAELPESGEFPRRWLALKFMEDDQALKKTPPESVRKLLTEWNISGWNEAKLEMAITDAKYQFIGSLMPDFVRYNQDKGENWTQRLDRWALSPIWGYPILLAILVIVFWFSFVASAPFGDLISRFMGWVAGALVALLQMVGAPQSLQSLIRDGIFAGVGAVFAFVPQIGMFFIFYSILQDSGYLARAAFLGDRFMQAMGLHGKSFFSFVSSYGCNVPGIMATRTLENPKDRLITILLNPLIPCVPRLGVMSAVVAAFFPGGRGALVMVSLLGLSLLLIIFSSFLFRKTVIQIEKSAFVMELPLYHRPTIRNVLLPAWQKTFNFMKRAWTFILVASIIIWFLSSFPTGVSMEQTWAGKLGSALAVIGSPLGFDWRIMVAILFGFTAKETTLSTLGILYGVTADSPQSIAQAMTGAMTPLVAFTFLVVYMIYIPCLATVVTMHKEIGSLRWTGFGVVYNLLLSFGAGWLVLQLGHVLGF